MWKRITIKANVFNSIVIDTEVTLTMPKYGIVGNPDEKRRLYIERRYIDNMITRLTARGWKLSRHNWHTTVLLREGE